jgi:hypothetical protein
MRVRPHIRLAWQAFRQFHRTEMVEKYERTHHVAVGVWQDSPDLEASEAAPPLVDQHDAHG